MKVLKLLSLLAIGGMAIAGCQVIDETVKRIEVDKTEVSLGASEDAEDTVTFTVAEAGGTFSYSFTDNGDSWLSASPTETSENSGTFTFTAKEENTSDERSTDVTITYKVTSSGYTAIAKVTVTQEAGTSGGGTSTPELVLESDAVTIRSGEDSEGTVNFSITNGTGSAEELTINNSESWLEVVYIYTNPDDYSEGTITLTATSKNDTGSERTATLTITYLGSDEVTVTVTQLAAPVINVDATATLGGNLGEETYLTYYVTNPDATTGQTVTVTVESAAESWLSADADASAGQIIFSAKEDNETGSSREGKVTVSYPDADDVEITVTQAAWQGD